MSFEESVELGLGDWLIEGLSWDAEGGVKMEFRDTGDEKVSVYFSWVAKMLVNLNYGIYSGQPLIWEASAKKEQQGTWRLEIDCTPMGSIAFSYDTATVIG